MAVVLAIDAGTTGVRTVAVDEHGRPGAYAYREFTQHFPRPGWVEHDADEIWRAVSDTLGEVVDGARRRNRSRRSGSRTSARPPWCGIARPARRSHRALVWQDRRTADRCDALRAAGHEPLVRARTGLVLDPYFSATKLEWLLTEGGVERSADARVRHRRLVDPVEPHRWRRGRRARHRTVERESHAALRHRRARVVRRSCSALFDVPALVPARGAADERSVRHDRARLRPPACTCR